LTLAGAGSVTRPLASSRTSSLIAQRSPASAWFGLLPDALLGITLLEKSIVLFAFV